MFEPDVVQTRLCFLAAAASGCDELIIDRDGGFPLRIFLQQSRRELFGIRKPFAINAARLLEEI